MTTVLSPHVQAWIHEQSSHINSIFGQPPLDLAKPDVVLRITDESARLMVQARVSRGRDVETLPAPDTLALDPASVLARADALQAVGALKHASFPEARRSVRAKLEAFNQQFEKRPLGPMEMPDGEFMAKLKEDLKILEGW